MRTLIKEISAIEDKIIRSKDWMERGTLAQEGFRKSVEIVKTVAKEEHKYMFDKIVEFLIEKRGLGWFSSYYHQLLVTSTDKKQIADHALAWIRHAREAGMKI